MKKQTVSKWLLGSAVAGLVLTGSVEGKFFATAQATDHAEKKEEKPASCGAGKCGAKKEEKAAKCGAGKCGAAKQAESKAADKAAPAAKCGAKKEEAPAAKKEEAKH